MPSEIFGPVESRRLGYSLGINHLPAKVCSYSCVYCQLGQTRCMSVQRKAYGDPDQIYRLTENRLVELSRSGRMPDTITLVPNGEPTLDRNIAEIIHQLKIFAIPIAVITNSSYLWQQEVRANLADADIVSVKVDSTDETIWKKVNRPHGSLRLTKVLEGIRDFAKEFKGKLITETMLIEGLNDDGSQAADLAKFLKSIELEKIYFSLPLRPPAEAGIRSPRHEAIDSFTKVFNGQSIHPVWLGEIPETDVDCVSGKIDSLINILKVHPLSEPEIFRSIKTMGIPKEEISRLVEKNILQKKKIEGKTFYSYHHPDK